MSRRRAATRWERWRALGVLARVQRTQWRSRGWVGSLFGLVALLVVGCATPRTGSVNPSSDGSTQEVAAAGFARGAERSEAEDPTSLIAQAEAALSSNEAARAVALFGRALAMEPPAAHAAPAWIGLAQAHEKLRDCIAAIRAYSTYLERFPEEELALVATARRGACEAELEQWEVSAATFHAIAERPGPQLPSVMVEALAREGYALFMLDRLDEAEPRLLRANEIYERALEEQTERFSSRYFIGMARFYRAAILHRRFRDVEIRLPEKVMAAAFTAKLELLTQAQEAYNDTISAKHMFWVSAAGFQLGHLFSELYDALMYAPVPDWLDDRQREIYYEELKAQLRPVITKAVWVFEKNLETARRLGYDSEFIERTQEKLGHLQAVLLSDDAAMGRPHDRLAKIAGPAIDAPSEPQEGSAADRKLFVPRPTAL